jgi:hypothetical protein
VSGTVQAYSAARALFLAAVGSIAWHSLAQCRIAKSGRWFGRKLALAVSAGGEGVVPGFAAAAAVTTAARFAASGIAPAGVASGIRASSAGW